ncbi:polysaccharide export protein [Mucilaginibacter pallidiroseus]|uniref:Polysaccharide export protein n=1 Tax=Mucilaginibacter pallidiroseus TaxID=2599295 RepID=A0A563U8C6_9SPHI|nr:polysaccharide biosynthesis/export family protein [Mucilaginibacter pallidiroseus]TWR27600.1 polysaccharide export protein [Mucilaginibacter pallidiroseus]
MSLKNFTNLFLIALVFLGMSSCTSYKNVPYFKDLPLDSIKTETIGNFTPLTIQPGDLLGLHVNSLNPDASYMFNYNLERPNGTSNLDKAEESAVIGYLVDQQGDIHLPLVGAVHLQGQSTLEASKTLEAKLVEVVKQPKVNVRIQNFKVSVLGDVKAPGTFNIVNERITVTEALSRAGDLNVTGIRNILLVREIDGKREYVPLDLKSKKIFTSPYYYLKNNDVIYVTPNRARSENDGSSFQRVSLLVSLLSVVAIILTR